MANTVRILVTAKDEVSGAFDRIQDKATLLSKTDIGKGMLQGAGIAAFGAIQAAAMGALDAVVDFGAGSIQAARDEEIGLAKLSQAISANVKAWDGNTSAIEDVIEAREKLGFSDGEQRDSLAKLVATTKDVDKALAIQATAMDFARLRGIDLATAGDILAKVWSGNVGILGRYGVQLARGTTATEALAAVSEMAAGQAEAFGNTTEGAAAGAAIALENLQEDIGAELLPVLTDLSKWVRDEGVPAMRDFVAVVKDNSEVFGVIADVIGSAVDTFNPLGDTVEDLQDKVDTATEAFFEDAKQWDTGSERIGKGLNGLTKASGNLAGGIDEVGDESKDTRAELKKLEKAANDALDAFLEATLGPEELKLELRNSKDELGENQREAEKLEDKIRRFKDAGKPVGELKDDLADLRLEIIKDKEDAIRATARLEDMGEVPMGSTETAIKRLIGPLDRVQQEAWDAYAALRAVAGAGGGPVIRNGFNVGDGNASGGYIAPYTSSLVGEYRPEMVTAGSSGLYVNPSPAAAPAGASGGGGPVVVQLVADGRILAEVLAPGVTAWQQDRRLLARA